MSDIRIAADHIEMRPIAELLPYAQNARTHSAEQIELLQRNMREFGFVSPLLIDKAGNILAGHGRLMAAAGLGMESVPCAVADGLTDEQRRAYILADNRLCELGGWNDELLHTELEALDLGGFDVSLTGFEPMDALGIEAERPEDGTPDAYEAFIDKFKAKHTTDDCFTPENIYECVRDYCVERYSIDPDCIVRPFYPGGDYQNFRYEPGAVVVDNPPFSILTEIVNWFNEHGVRYFLFAPATSLLHHACTVIAAYASVTYANGAIVNTSFLTNMEPGTKIRTAPDLSRLLRAIDDTNAKEQRREVGTYDYPDSVLTAAMAGKYSHYGVWLTIKDGDCRFIRALDAQKYAGKAIFGGGILLSDKAAAEKAAAEKAAAEKAAAEKAAAEKAAPIKWELSERELAIVEELSHGNEEAAT